MNGSMQMSTDSPSFSKVWTSSPPENTPDMYRRFVSNSLLPNPSFSGESWLPLMTNTGTPSDTNDVRNESSIVTASVVGVVVS